jgi:hypothetical protein
VAASLIGSPALPGRSLGVLSGVVNDAGKPLEGGGIVFFFNTEKGIPPMIADMHHIPDMVGRIGPDGKFKVTSARLSQQRMLLF